MSNIKEDILKIHKTVLNTFSTTSKERKYPKLYKESLRDHKFMEIVEFKPDTSYEHCQRYAETFYYKHNTKNVLESNCYRLLSWFFRYST